jgi:DNA-binding NarL/FixJ family response regulator
LIRVLLVDDHPSVRAGVHAALRLEPGLVPVGEAVTAEEGIKAAHALQPDVVVADYHLPDEDGLVMCERLKAEARTPRVLLFSAYANSGLVVPALLAGADGLVDKGVPADHLCEAIRLVARAGRVFPQVTPAQLRGAAQRLDEEEIPVFAMLLDRVPQDEIASALGIDLTEVRRHLHTILRRLGPRPTVASGDVTGNGHRIKRA